MAARFVLVSLVAGAVAGPILFLGAVALVAVVNEMSFGESAGLVPQLIDAVYLSLFLGALAATYLVAGLSPHRVLLGLKVGVGLLGSAILLVGAIACTVLLLGELPRGDADQLRTPGWAALLVLAIVAAVVVSVPLWVALRRGAGLRVSLIVVVLVCLAGVPLAVYLAVQTRPEPRQALRSPPHDPRVNGWPDVRHDVILVVDPSDAAGRRVLGGRERIPGAGRHRRRDAVAWDTAYGIAVVGADPPLVATPTTDRAALADGLDRARRAARGPRTVGDAIEAITADPRSAGWRPGALRSLAVVAETPPSARDMELSSARGGAVPDVVARLAAPAIRLDAVFDRLRGGAARSWRDWAESTGGSAVERREGATAFEQAEDLTTGTAAREEDHALAFRHRPFLHFDHEEKNLPLDVDSFLLERGSGGEPAHRLCHEEQIGFTCKPVSTGLDLEPDVNDRDDIVAFDDRPAGTPENELRPRRRERPVHQRIYYHAVHEGDGSEDGHRRHLDYWFFYRYNESPKLRDHTCLPGLSIKEVTCFDHQGDWEGVTATLVRRDGEWRPESAVYVGHHWRYRISWAALEDAGAATEARPHVWVARGSHASYPAACGERSDGTKLPGRLRSCKQPRSAVPDGNRSGERPWQLNDDDACRAEHCVLPLPITREGGPAGWAAFGGNWGMHRCAVGTKLCERSLGPSSPFFQKRYGTPGHCAADDLLLNQWYGSGPGPGKRGACWAGPAPKSAD